MNILLITANYPPEIRSSSHLMQELAEELHSRGHQVAVTTSYPDCNLSKSDEALTFPVLADEDEVRVLRVKMPIHPNQKVNFVGRGISHLMLPYAFTRAISRHLPDKFDAVVVYSPPLTLTRVGLAIKKKLGARLVLNVQDIFPQNAVDLGILTNPLLIKFFEAIEASAYRGADVITVHSPNNGRFLATHKKVPLDKMITLHNWIDLGAFKGELPPTNLRGKLGLEGKFIIFFGGVIGPSQALHLFVEAARDLEDYPEIMLLLMGDGKAKQGLEKMVRKYGMQNVIFHPFIPKEQYQAALREIDVGMICLSKQNHTPVVPGKLLSYMAASVPVLALLNKESDGHAIVREANCGYSAVSEGSRQARELMLRMYQERDSLSQFGQNGLRYATEHFSKEMCVDKLEEQLK